MNKKVISLVLSVVMLFIVLTACSHVSVQSNINSSSLSVVSKSQSVDTNNIDSNIQCYFPRENEDAEKALIDVINFAKSTLNIAIYSITDKNISNAIIEAQQRKVDIKIITDKVQSSNKHQKLILSDLKNANIPIKVDTHKGIMHLKIIIADNKIITTGSYNYTDGARDNNDEVLVVIYDLDTVNQFSSEFDHMWNDNDNFIDY